MDVGIVLVQHAERVLVVARNNSDQVNRVVFFKLDFLGSTVLVIIESLGLVKNVTPANGSNPN